MTTPMHTDETAASSQSGEPMQTSETASPQSADSPRTVRAAGPWLLCGLILITAIAAATRLHKLDRPSFWGDELQTIRAIGMPEDIVKVRMVAQLATATGLWASGIDLRRIDPERPDTWRALGITEWNARIGSAVLGVLTVPILILASRRLIGTPAAMLAGLLLALAPWHILWSQAARFYTLQFLFYTLCLIWYFRWRHERSARLLVATVVGLILAVLAQPTSLLALGVIVADVAIGIWRGEIALSRREKGLLMAGGGACVGLLAFFIAAQPEPWMKFIAFAGEARYHRPTTLMAGTVYMVQLPLAALAGLSALWLLGRDRTMGIFLILAITVPLVALAFWSLWNFVGLRYVLITLWWWLVLSSIGLIALYRSTFATHGRAIALAPAAVAVVALLVPLYAYYEDGYGYRGRWREAFAYVEANRQSDEEVATTFNQLHVAQYYLGTLDVRPMAWTLRDAVRAFDQPTWLVFHSETSVRGTEQEWTRDIAQLRAVFDLRIPQPIELVEVYRFVPGLVDLDVKEEEDEKSADAPPPDTKRSLELVDKRP